MAMNDYERHSLSAVKLFEIQTLQSSRTLAGFDFIEKRGRLMIKIR